MKAASAATEIDSAPVAADVAGYRQGRLYRLGLVAGLGASARPLAERIRAASRNAWTRGVVHGRAGAVNGGSPLEVSVRSDQWPSLRYTSVVGEGHGSVQRRCEDGAAALRDLARHCFDTTGGIDDALHLLASWWKTRNFDDGVFGCYLSGSHSRRKTRLKLYLDLFGKARPQPALQNWAELLAGFGQPAGAAAILREMQALAQPIMGCFEPRVQGPPNWRLYWRLAEPSAETFERIAALLDVDTGVCRAVRAAFDRAAGGPSRTEPQAGFVHPVPVRPGCLVFYSQAPSCWADVGAKRAAIRRIWENWGGDPAALAKVWELARGVPLEKRWTPVLTLLALGVAAGEPMRASAYFRVPPP